MTEPFGVRTSYSAQSRLKMMPLLSVLSTFERIDPMSKPLRVMIATSIPRSSFPSTSITCRYNPPSKSRLNRSSAGLSSTSTNPNTFGTDVPDHPGCHTCGSFIDCLFGELNPPDPITASVGYDLHILFVIARLAVKRTTIFSKPRPLRIQCLIAANLLLFFCRLRRYRAQRKDRGFVFCQLRCIWVFEAAR